MAVRLPALVLIAALAACRPAPAPQPPPVVPAAADVPAAVAKEITPVTVAVEAAAAEIFTAALPPPPAAAAVDPRIIKHIVRWEVTSPARYTQKYEGVICPGGASGPTWGIGYDGGHQAVRTIQNDWAGHPDVVRLSTTSGHTGEDRCARMRARLLDIRVPYAMAEEVFTQTSYPVWSRATARAYPGVDDIGTLAAGALVGNTYNRGTSMLGSRAAEKRMIRDRCIPRQDRACVAEQLRAQKRLWPEVKGLRDRRESEAQLAETHE